MDGPAAAAVPARPHVTAGPDVGRQRRLFVRPASDMALRVRRCHAGPSAHRGVRSARLPGARPRLVVPFRMPLPSRVSRLSPRPRQRSGVAGCLLGGLNAGGQAEFGVDVAEVGFAVIGAHVCISGGEIQIQCQFGQRHAALHHPCLTLPQRRRSWPDLRIIHAEGQAVGDVISVKLFAVLHHLVEVGITASAGDDEPNCRDVNGGDGNAWLP